MIPSNLPPSRPPASNIDDKENDRARWHKPDGSGPPWRLVDPSFLPSNDVDNRGGWAIPCPENRLSDEEEQAWIDLLCREHEDDFREQGFENFADALLWQRTGATLSEAQQCSIRDIQLDPTNENHTLQYAKDKLEAWNSIMDSLWAGSPGMRLVDEDDSVFFDRTHSAASMPARTELEILTEMHSLLSNQPPDPDIRQQHLSGSARADMIAELEKKMRDASAREVVHGALRVFADEKRAIAATLTAGLVDGLLDLTNLGIDPHLLCSMLSAPGVWGALDAYAKISSSSSVGINAVRVKESPGNEELVRTLLEISRASDVPFVIRRSVILDIQNREVISRALQAVASSPDAKGHRWPDSLSSSDLEWYGFKDRDDAHAWARVGATPGEAHDCIELGLTVDPKAICRSDFRDWAAAVDVGDDPSRHGFANRADALKWQNAGFRMDDVQALRKLGLGSFSSWDDARAWLVVARDISIGLDLSLANWYSHTVDLRKQMGEAGISSAYATREWFDYFELPPSQLAASLKDFVAKVRDCTIVTGVYDPHELSAWKKIVGLGNAEIRYLVASGFTPETYLASRRSEPANVPPTDGMNQYLEQRNSLVDAQLALQLPKDLATMVRENKG